MRRSEAFAGLVLPLGLGEAALAEAKHAVSTGDVVWLVVIAAVVLGGREYWHAKRHPFGPCWKCGGSGRNAGSTGKRHGICGRCGGSGRKVRLSARLLNRTRGRTK